MENKKTQLHPAYKLGNLLEAKAAISRRKTALDYLKTLQLPIHEERLLSLEKEEIAISEGLIIDLAEQIKDRIPHRLYQAVHTLSKTESSGLGNMDLQNLSILHSAIAGLIEESTVKGSTWHSLQLGRLIQRASTVIKVILSGIEDQHMPENRLLTYISIQTESPVPDTSLGTHLWNVHKVFENLLKVSKNPKSLESTLIRIGLHIESLPQPEDLKRDFEKLRMGQNRISNDLTFVDVHELIGDDPEDHLSRILDFFQRQHTEIDKLMSLCGDYLQVFESYVDELTEFELFDYEP